MSSIVDQSSHPNYAKICTIQTINQTVIPTLIDHLTKVHESIRLSTPDNITTTGSGSSSSNVKEKNDNEDEENTKDNTGCCGGSSSKDKEKTGNKTSNNSSGNDSKNSALQHQLDKLRRNLNFVKDAFEKLKEFEDHVGIPIDELQSSVDVIFQEVEETPESSFVKAESLQPKLRKVNDIVKKLKLQVWPAHKISPGSAAADPHRDTRSDPSTSGSGYNARHMFDGLPNLHMNEQFRRSSAFKDIQEIYESLDITSRHCLSCFTVFPENEVVKKRVMIYWWVGEGLIVPPRAGQRTAEDIAEDVFKELMVKGFIEPVEKMCGLVADRFEMHPFIRSAVIMLAQEAGFFDFDSKGTPTANFSSCRRACLVKSEGGGSSQQVPINSPNWDQGKLETLFNVSEPYLGFKMEWFSKMKNVNVLYLGRWQSRAKHHMEDGVKHHIEVEDTEFLKGLKNMKQLKFLCLQGISRITELHDSICRLTNLRILDLGACHNLEVLPDGIGLLKNLTHLDMSECYLVDHMPKGLASLLELQVLKGFVIGDSTKSPCTVADLVNLKRLRKLSISAGSEFPSLVELTSFYQFTALRKLTIAWGGDSLKAESDNSAKPEGGAVEQATEATKKPRRGMSKLSTFKRDKTATPVIRGLPMSLEKLDLQCVPWMKTPDWLRPGKLKSLKKLYIRGGKLHGLGQVEDDNNDRWKVEILRMKFLQELNMDWEGLQALFPDLIYLEKVACPNLKKIPCNDSGVWWKETMEPKQLPEIEL
ncbi:hypothetical protein L1049_016066 [Liquidambar formosana]|uniref:Disease resistance RPP13-like protein 4 n=1 Tax=Liquidambar formosana TaxID=63359 RepID=A0AAP0S521_LIQFO